MTNNPWRILGVTKYSTQEEIQSAYKKQAMQKHPDRGGSVKEFQELNQAYKELMGNKIPVLTKPTTKLVHVTLTIEQQVLGYKGMIECSTGEILDLNIPAGARVNDKFKVKINTLFNKRGKMLVGEYLLKGKSSQEILISTYICHPSLANDNLSGILVSLNLINHFKKIKNLKKTIRFVFLPETIGSIAYLDKNLRILKKNTIGGFNLTCLGNDAQHSFIQSKYGSSPSDLALTEAYKKLKIKAKKYSFLERGSDERQFNSPGIDLPITTVCRSKFEKFKEYHTSLDNFNFIKPKALSDSFKVIKTSIELMMNKHYPRSKILCEPFMSKRGMYPTISKKDNIYLSKNLLNFLQYSDGKNDLFSISKLIKLSFNETKNCSKILKKYRLIDY